MENNKVEDKISSPNVSNGSPILKENKDDILKKKNFYIILNIFLLSASIFFIVNSIILIYGLRQISYLSSKLGYIGKNSKVIEMQDYEIVNYGIVIHNLKLKYRDSKLFIKGFITIDNEILKNTKISKSSYLKCLFRRRNFKNYSISLEFLDKDGFPIVSKILSSGDFIKVVNNDEEVLYYSFIVTTPISYYDFKEIKSYVVNYMLNPDCLDILLE